MMNFRGSEIVFDENVVHCLQRLTGRLAFIVTDQRFVPLALLQQVEVGLTRAHIAVAVFAEVEPNPSLETVRSGVEMARPYESA